MGTIQSKIREGYSLKQKPCLKKKQQRGVKPVQESLEKWQKYRKVSAQQNSQLGQKSKSILFETILTETQSLQNLEFLQSEHSFAQTDRTYPVSAIGLIQTRIDGMVKYSTGSLINTNIVLTTAQCLYNSRRKAEASEVKIILSSVLGQEQYQADKIFTPQQFTTTFSNEEQYWSKSMDLNYGVIILKTHIDVKRYGILGFDFDQKDENKSMEAVLYGFNQRKKSFKIDRINIKAKIKDHYIKFNSLFEFDVAGGPIILFKDNQCIVIGLHNQDNRCQLSQQRGIRINEKMYEQICSWITQEEEEIDLRDKSLGKEGVKKLIKLEKNSLSSINISKNKIGPQGLKYLARCEWTRLHHLDIGGNDIKKQGVAHLIKIPMKNILSLNMWGNSIGSQGVLLLLQADWKHLSNINLYNNDICNDGIKTLTNANWEELQSINLGKNCITSNIIPSFQYAIWKDIVSLNIWGNQIKTSKAIEAQFQKYFRKMKFFFI